jgi:lactoylglutathione lyase
VAFQAPGCAPAGRTSRSTASERFALGALEINHVAVNAIDLEASVDFYVSLFGMERIPTYTFAFPTQFLRLGNTQLHVFQRPCTATAFHHVGLVVDDIQALYLKSRELGILDSEAFFSPIYELPDGSVQLYLRDPAGNLVEIDAPDASVLDRAVVGEIPRLADLVPQTDDARGATLFHLLRPPPMSRATPSGGRSAA